MCPPLRSYILSSLLKYIVSQPLSKMYLQCCPVSQNLLIPLSRERIIKARNRDNGGRSCWKNQRTRVINPSARDLTYCLVRMEERTKTMVNKIQRTNSIFGVESSRKEDRAHKKNFVHVFGVDEFAPRMRWASSQPLSPLSLRYFIQLPFTVVGQID